MQDLKDKKIIIAISSSISIYKSADLISMLKKRGAEIKVIMTKNATEMMSPIIFKTLSQNKVYTSLWENSDNSEVAHITLAQWADIFLVCPCTANTLANLANGLAPDFLSSTYLATRAKSFIALAMNDKMYAHPAVQANIQKAITLGINIIEPINGNLACGTSGKGKLATLEDIIEAIS